MIKRICILLLSVLSLASCAKYSGTDFSAYKNMPARTILVQAEKNCAKGSYAKATKDLEALDALYPFGKYSQQGQLDSIYAYYMNDDIASALVAADRYIRLYPRDRDVDYAYYMKGLISFEEGFTWLQKMAGSDPSARDMTNKKQAYLAFSDLVRFFPSSRYAPDAAVHMQYIRNLMAQHDMHIAQFYFKRKAFVAAANRASDVVEHYDGTPAVPSALAMMVRAYRELGLSTMANNTYAILQASYPESKAFRRLS